MAEEVADLVVDDQRPVGRHVLGVDGCRQFPAPEVGLTTRLLLSGMPTLAPGPRATPAATYGPPPEESPTDGPVEVTTSDKGVSIELAAEAGELSGLAVDQPTCTALGVQRLADPGAEPSPVTVTGPDGRQMERRGASCPER
ncbi:hypothetical protein J7E95_37710 [Streptomyces sp. ISL-14]|nr:hypothetical protein [Streptomyces sp. ISL-14]